MFRVSDVRRHHRFFRVLPMHHGTSTIVIISFSVSGGRVARLTSTSIPVVNVGSISPRIHKFATTIGVGSMRKSALTTHRLVGLNRHSVTCVDASHSISLGFSIRGQFNTFARYYHGRNVRPRIVIYGISSTNHCRVDSIIARLVDLPGLPATVTYRRSNVTLPLVFRLRHGNLSIPNSMSLVNCSSDFCASSVNLAAVHRGPMNVTHGTTRVALSLVRRGPISRPCIITPTRLIIHSSATGVH